MEDDENKYQSIIDQKCPQCFRKDECVLLPSQKAMLCLRPFKDGEEGLKKVKDDKEKDRKRADRKGISGSMFGNCIARSGR